MIDNFFSFVCSYTQTQNTITSAVQQTKWQWKHDHDDNETEGVIKEFDENSTTNNQTVWSRCALTLNAITSFVEKWTVPLFVAYFSFLFFFWFVLFSNGTKWNTVGCRCWCRRLALRIHICIKDDRRNTLRFSKRFISINSLLPSLKLNCWT